MSNFDEDFFKKLLKEEREECLKCPGLELELHEAFISACQKFQDAYEGMISAEQNIEQNMRRNSDTLRRSSSHKGPGSLDRDRSRRLSSQVCSGSFTGVISSDDVDQLNVWNSEMENALNECVETAKPLLETINLTDFDLEMSLLRTAILSRATSKGLSKFANESDLNGQLIETMLNSKKIMKEMILHGGARDNAYGNAMKLFTQIMAKSPQDKFQKINKKIAMAAALEFASPVTEFDTSIEISAQDRFTHYANAHRKGDLDPSFTHLKTWEYRLAMNSDAPDEQLQWGRNMLMTYAPHIVSIYDQKYRYCYAVKSDVGYRAPRWTGSPRTYQQVLSGGGREGPRAWFGRFICQAFGIPVWGLKQPGNVAMSRWTPDGWKLNFSVQRNEPEIDWRISSWEGRSGRDFIMEANARSAVSEQEYFEKVILLECLADACKEKVKTQEDSEHVHPNRVWRSLALMQKKIFADEQLKSDSFKRTGPALIITKIDQYIQDNPSEPEKEPCSIDEKTGTIRIPGISFVKSNGKKFVKPLGSFLHIGTDIIDVDDDDDDDDDDDTKSDDDDDNGSSNDDDCFNNNPPIIKTQVHFMDGESEVSYEMPTDLIKKKSPKKKCKNYMITIKVCTVHLEQQPLNIQIDDNIDNVIQIPLPYTIGKWKTTKPIKISGITSKSILRFYRKKAEDCFGLAIKHFTLSPC